MILTNAPFGSSSKFHLFNGRRQVAVDAKNIHTRNTLLERMTGRERKGDGLRDQLREEPGLIYVGGRH